MKTDLERIDEAYKKTISARNFHYESFNKWMTYYYVAVAALFVAMYSGKCDSNIHALSLVGFVISSLWHLSCKGYYFWIHNWSKLVMRYENELPDIERVYSVFSKQVANSTSSLIITKSANISTSKATLVFSFVVVVYWCYMLVSNTYWLTIGRNICNYIFLSVLISFAFLWILGKILTSDIDSHKLI